MSIWDKLFNRKNAPEIPAGYVLAPKRLVEGKLPVCYMYREAPDNNQDTGWRFFSGSETDEYVNDPDNIGLYDIQTIMNNDKDVIPYLSAPYGSAYERAGKSQPFSAVEN